MSTQSDELQYTGSFKVGDRVVVERDPIDGSWEGEEGTVVHVYRQKGGIFGAERNVEIVVPDAEDEDDLHDTDEGLATLAQRYEDSNVYFMSSDDYDFEAL